MSRVQSIERAFAVLGALADGPIGVTEVAERADLPKSTAARLLASLAREGAVEQVPGDTRYRLGPAARDARGRHRPDPLAGRRLARPLAGGAGGRAGEAAGLSVADGDVVHYVDQVGTPEPGPGPRLDRHADPAARRLVRPGAAGLRAADVRPALPRRPMERFTHRTLVTADALLERLRDVRRDGHAWALRRVRRGDLVEFLERPCVAVPSDRTHPLEQLLRRDGYTWAFEEFDEDLVSGGTGCGFPARSSRRSTFTGRRTGFPRRARGLARGAGRRCCREYLGESRQPDRAAGFARPNRSGMRTDLRAWSDRRIARCLRAFTPHVRGLFPERRVRPRPARRFTSDYAPGWVFDAEDWHHWRRSASERNQASPVRLA